MLPFMTAHVSVPAKSAARRAFVRSVEDATSDVPDDELRSPKVLRVLLERLADRVLPTSDPLAKARIRGTLEMRKLLNADGGAFTGKDVAQLLGISRQAVDKRRKAGQLLALELPKRGLLYPAWQFGDGSDVLPGLVDVLSPTLHAHDAWARARFFVTENDRLRRRASAGRVLRRGLIEPVLEAAQSFGQHGAV